MEAAKKFLLKTFGCQMNVYDGRRVEGMLGALGYERTDDAAEADVIVLNTCAVRAKATDKVFSELGRIRKRKKPGAVFGIMGCVAREAGAEAFKKIPGLNFVLGPQQYHKLPLVLENPDAPGLYVDLSGLEKFDELPKMTSSELIAYMPVQEGCGHCCAYCIVPYVRGPELSRPFGAVMEDVRRAADGGAIEICFLGQNVNGYENAGHRLSDLIIETAKIGAVKRIRYTSSYPTEMKNELIALHGAEPKLLPFLNLPIQSGSPDVLRRMNRPYRVEDYFDIVARLRAARPGIQISSDFIVGFPGETDEDFERTCKVAKDVGYINSYTFKYSKRPHTPAAAMPDQVPEKIKSERLKILDDIISGSTRAFNESCVGKTFDCLLDGRNYRTPFMQQVVVGKNGADYVRIKITDGNKCSLRGEICGSI